MRVALCESDRKRAACCSASESSSKSQMPYKLSDKENCLGPFRSSGFRNLLCRPNEQYVCMELPLENYANKKLRSIVPAECETSKRYQAPKKSRCSYLKPGALAQLRDLQRQKQGKKRVAEADAVATTDIRIGDEAPHISGSPERVPAGIVPRSLGPACLQRKKLLAPKFSALLPAQNNEATSMAEGATASDETGPSSSYGTTVDSARVSTDNAVPNNTSLETLPLELLVRIVCRLDHNELKPVFHVCNSLRQAVMIARQCHFNFTTPGREHKTVSDAPNQKPDHALPFLSDFAAVGISTRQLSTPNAPRHAVKAPKPRISVAEMRQIAATLFQQGSSQQPQLPGPVAVNNSGRLPGASHRALFNEEELCKAIAQNTL